ncbi:MAG TPA: extradiol ring-cleavage dioxygenase [Vicinamibacteria bacterium]|nr:extradiol ring-cleavage dioxygenase [Vicinamibacteria bacterium]
MADIVLGMGTSHTPMLFTPPEDWPKFEARDRAATLLDQNGEPRTFEELAAKARVDVSTNGHRDAYLACQRHLDRLAEALAESELDVVVIIGDDQKELFQEENLPAVLVYWGETIDNKCRAPKSGEPAWWSAALGHYYGRGRDETFPVASALALHIIETLMEHDFDVAQSKRLPKDHGEGHAFGFVHARLMNYGPIPVVPVFLNTYYPPNQPTPTRCLRLGRALREAVNGWREGRVGVVASGGLSHFVIDEELDRSVLRALDEGDDATLAGLPQKKLNSGTSEIRNWITMYGASEHLTPEWIEYVPCYRTRAGTGTGCAFGLWK